MSAPVWSRAEVESPCIRLCVVDPGSGLCMGCYRTMDEIAAWSRMVPETRQTIMTELPERADRIRPVRRGGAAARRDPPTGAT